MVTIARPPRVPKNLRYAPLAFLPVLALQGYILINPPKQVEVPLRNLQTFLQKDVDQHLATDPVGTVQPGSTLTYTLLTTNSTNHSVQATARLDLSDIEQYADVTDLHGAVVKNDVASWQADELAAGQSSTHEITIQVAAVPSNQATGIMNPKSYDSKLEASYGNSVVTTLAPSLSKQVELYTRNLPFVPAPLGTLITLGLGLIWLLMRFGKHERTQMPGILLWGWLIGSFTVLELTLLASLKNGFELRGSEFVIGGLGGILLAFVLLQIHRLSRPNK